MLGVHADVCCRMLGVQVSQKRDSSRVASRLISMDLQVLNEALVRQIQRFSSDMR